MLSIRSCRCVVSKVTDYVLNSLFIYQPSLRDFKDMFSHAILQFLYDQVFVSTVG